MKELETLKEVPIEIREEQQQKKEIKFIGSQRMIRGHTLFELNTKTGDLLRATFKKETVEIKTLSLDKSKINNRLKVEVKEHCFYIQALNRKNAIKKLKNLGILKPLKP